MLYWGSWKGLATDEELPARSWLQESCAGMRCKMPTSALHCSPTNDLLATVCKHQLDGDFSDTKRRGNGRGVVPKCRRLSALHLIVQLHGLL